MANREDEYKRLRSYLNKFIRGEKTDAVLRSVASGPAHLVNNVEAVNDSLYIVSAQSKYLDARLGDYGIVRPVDVGMSDDVFRNIGIEIKNRKQVRDLVNQLLRILYGEIYTRATSYSQEFETYNLQDGDNLIVSFDETDSVEVVFTADQFSNINSATAQEVADAITKSIRKQGFTGSAFSVDNGNGAMVALISSTDGPSSTVRVFGGSAQNVLKFETIRPTSGGATTQWTLTQEAGGNIRATWSGGQDPSLGKIKIGDYANMYGSSFDAANKGTFIVTDVQGGPVGSSYFEFVNPNGMPETVVQGTEDAVLFFFATLRTLNSNTSYAAAFQTSPRELEIFMPATTRVVRRGREGAAHLHGQVIDTGTTSDSPSNLLNDQNTEIFSDSSTIGDDQKAFSFTTNGTGEMESISLAFNKDGTEPITGKFKIELRADDSGAPGAVVLGETVEIDIPSLTQNPDGNLVEYFFEDPIAVLGDATDYWVVIQYTEALSAAGGGPPVVSETIEQLTDNSYISAANTSIPGQTFTTINGGELVDVTFVMTSSSPPAGTCSWDIYEVDGGGLPTGSPIASSESLDISTVPGGLVPATFTLDFLTPVTLDPATQYALVLDNSGITSNGGFFTLRISTASSYADGNIIQSFDSGSTWGTSGTQDLNFSINLATAAAASTALAIETDSTDAYSGEWLESTDGGSSWATPSGAPVVSETIQSLVSTDLYGLSATVIPGQTFTPASGGVLVDATMRFEVGGGGTPLPPTGFFKYDVYATNISGLPVGAPLASTDLYDASTIPADLVQYDYTLPFSTPVSLSPGTKYALVLDTSAITFFGSAGWSQAKTNADTYAGGNLILSTDGGSSFGAAGGGGYELYFAVNLGTPASVDYSPYFESSIIPTILSVTDPSEGLGGPYSYDPTVGYTLGEQAAAITQEIDGVDDTILFVDDSSDFPDEDGKLIIGFGTARQEGPVPYISRPSSQSLRINPAYNFKNQHPAGTDISLISQNAPAKPSIDGTDFPFYVTDSVAGRIYAEQLLQEITATGIRVVIYILYPDDIGLGKEGDVVNSEKYYIWGREEDL